MRPSFEAASFCALFTTVTLVNKHVLTDLKFQFPTIFQGWQTFVGAVVLQSLRISGKVDFDATVLSRDLFSGWFPYFCVYVLCIYTGSVALSQLPVPLFLCLKNITNVLNLKLSVLSPSDYLSGTVILVTCLFLSQFHEKIDRSSYLWMFCHIASCVILVNYPEKVRNIPKLGDLRLLYISYVCSFVLLLPSTVILGDLSASAAFPFWHHRPFYVGCVISGIFGALTNISWFSIKDRPLHLLNINISPYGVAKIFAACGSFYIFPLEDMYNYTYYLCVMLNLLFAATLQEDASAHNTE